ncbi:TPA: hypothetical protein DEF17_07245 [bacterium]|nr:MAG: hypothetical protein AUJ18_08120 [Candidatus Hydrogenedentes bacterium CG1_02_42_14]HBW47709.1 hypothetical protein [bacterium]
MNYKFISYIAIFCLTLIFVNSISATPRDVRVIWAGSASSNKIAITFDDGPTPSNDDMILDVLKDAGARATFFEVGQRVKNSGAEGRRVLKRMLDEGHEIGNHSYSHLNAAHLSNSALQQDVELTQRIIESACGYRPILYRPPGGGIDFPAVRSLASTDIQTVVMWSIDPMDWKRPGRKKIWKYIADNLSPGAIILLHDTHIDTIKALPLLIDLIQARGYEIVTVSELLR